MGNVVAKAITTISSSDGDQDDREEVTAALPTQQASRVAKATVASTLENGSDNDIAPKSDADIDDTDAPVAEPEPETTKSPINIDGTSSKRENSSVGAATLADDDDVDDDDVAATVTAAAVSAMTAPTMPPPSSVEPRKSRQEGVTPGLNLSTASADKPQHRRKRGAKSVVSGRPRRQAVASSLAGKVLSAATKQAMAKKRARLASIPASKTVSCSTDRSSATSKSLALPKKRATHDEINSGPPNGYKVEVKCPICGKRLTTYSGQYWIPLPLTPDGIADWYQPWPKGTDGPKTAARGHFVKEHQRVEPPCGIKLKNKKRDIAKLPNGKADFRTYANLQHGEKKAEEKASNGADSDIGVTTDSASLTPSADKPHRRHKKILSASRVLAVSGGPHHAVASRRLSLRSSAATVAPCAARPTTDSLTTKVRTVSAKEAAEKEERVAETSSPIPASKKQKTAPGSTGRSSATSRVLLPLPRSVRTTLRYIQGYQMSIK